MAEVFQKNVDHAVAEGFGREWSTFRQGEEDLSIVERDSIFNAYFSVFPWDRLPADGGIGIDVGCGSGRWAMNVAPRVRHLHLLDVSEDALAVARENLGGASNVSFHLASLDAIPLPAESLDFAFSLGVVHHVPDTESALRAIAAKLRPGAPLLIYIYYAFDNRPAWYRLLWRATDYLRIVMSRMPYRLRYVLSQVIAATVYWPLARLAWLVDRLGLPSRPLPLSWLRDKSFYVMRTDAYDRFCTRLEKRFTKSEIEQMLVRAGFRDIRFSDSEPFWCAAGVKC